MTLHKKGELKGIKQSDFENDPKNDSLLIPETGREMISINHQLDHDCFVKIFSYIPALDRLQIRKVCKKWKEAVDMSWHNVKKIDTENLQILLHKKESTLKELLNNCCKYLTHLTIDYQYPWMTDVLKNNCKNIVNFDVKLSCEYWSPVRNVIRSMSKLKCLKAEVTSRQALGIFHQLLRQLPVDIEEIHLVASNLDKIPQDAPMLNKFRNLRCLTLRRFCLTTSTIESILLNKNSLIYLDLYGCFLPATECPIIFKKLVNLEHLNLGKVENLKIDMVIGIVNNCLNLKFFECSDLNNFIDFSIPRSVFRKFKYLINLEHLDIPRVVQSDDGNDDNLMSDVFDNCKKLKYLDVGEGRNFTTFDFEAITKLNNLQYLYLGMAQVDLQSFINITNNCFDLKELIIDFDDLPVIALEKLTNLKKLEKLDLADCDNLTGIILSKIVDNCKNLVDLNLSECNNVTKDSLIQVGKLDNLTILNISGIENVPIEMFDYFCKLEELVCYDCPSVTDEAIKKVIDNCLKLSDLNLYETGITVDTLVHAAKRKFSFKILDILVHKSLHREYLNLNGNKPSRYLQINFS